MAVTLRDRFAGCLLGHAVGDAFGAPFEGLTSDSIYAQFGRPSEIMVKPPVETFYCTDDTHMSLAVAEMLCDHGGIDEDALIQAFARGYDPKRGYGQGMRKLLEAVLFKEDWRTLAANLFPGGSFGNGGAMRAAPVGLFFHDDPDRVWEQARKSAAVTHRHPLGVEGAQLFAVAVALAVRGDAANREALWGELFSRATKYQYQWLIRTAWRLTPNDSLAMLGSGLEAHRSVVTAIACFSMSPDSYPTAVARALALGDDTDTVMGMAGALAGAHLGIGGIPRELVDRLEEGERGRTAILSRAEKLHEKFAARMKLKPG